MSLKAKLITFCLFIGLCPLFLMGFYSVHKAADSLTHQAFMQLEAVRDGRAKSLEELGKMWANEVRIFGANKGVFHALGMLRDYAYGVDEDKTFDVKAEDYVGTVDNIIGAFEPFVDVLGYGDAMLVDDYGWVLVSAKRGEEMGKNVGEKGLLKDTALHKAWAEAKEGKVSFVDFKPYPLLHGQPNAFIAAPVYNHTGDAVEGVAILRLNLKQINAVMKQRSGMGETGETYLVGPDMLMRSDSYLDPANHSVSASFHNPDLGAVKTDTVHKANSGEIGSELAKDYRGNDVLAAYRPVTIDGVTWALIAEVETSEAFGAVNSLIRAAIIMGLITAIGVVLLTLFVVRRELVRPLSAITAYLKEVAEGNFQAQLTSSLKAEMRILGDHILSMVGELKQKLGFSDGILKNMTIPCLVADTDNRVTFVNEPLLRLMEYDNDARDFIGWQASDLLRRTKEETTLTQKCFEQKRSICNVEQTIVGVCGASRNVRQDAAPLYDLDGNVTGSFALLTDLTDIRQKEAQISSQNDIFARVAKEAETISQFVNKDSNQLKEQVAQVTLGAEMQTERIMQTSIAMAQMNDTLLEVARSANEAATSAEKSEQKAAEGAQVVEDSVAAIRRVHNLSSELQMNMQELGKQAKDIGSIIGVINDIADQTNLLALNAAIEAARAGDAGRGFAVVADEVRKLAEKTMVATKEVSSSISAIQRVATVNIDNTNTAVVAIEEATELVNRSGETLGEIVGLSKETAGQVHSIARASEEQSAAHEQINMSMDEVKRIASETTDGMNHSARSIRDIAAQAGNLQDLIVQIR
ncbi:MAG: methyl-accepting chemotaxis protein [Desulfovibrio sp.]|uniref:methyl-accepting chemotaxis protein n=1 Tax=Desulfovibrio sp. 7SRBS1 TaxID=3378064 RepID=UPI003B3EB22A